MTTTPTRPPARRPGDGLVEVFAAAQAAHEAGVPVAIVVVVGVDGSAPRAAGARMLVGPEGRLAGTIGGGALEHRATAAAVEALRTGRPQRLAMHLTRDLGMCCGGAVELFIDPIAPAEDLVIHGAGHVGAATARIAAEAGFRVTVVDDRADIVEGAALPAGVRALVQDPLRALPALPTGPRSLHLVVSHDHALDQRLVEALLPLPVRWVGLIGSRAKVARFCIRLRAAGMAPETIARLRSPVGLDIGAETPAEIAISVVAELVRVRRGVSRPPVPLAEHPLPARDQPARGATEGAATMATTAQSRSS